MKKKLLIIFASVISKIMLAQVAVTVTNPANTTPNLAASYVSLAAAINKLNSITSISGPVILTCAAGSETAPLGGYTINFTATTTSTNNITLSGSGATITAYYPQVSGSLTDAIFKIIGSDFVTIQNFTMKESTNNSTTTAASNEITEFGVALFYKTTTNGAQNNTIQNNTISLRRNYSNSFGIYSNVRHSPTNPTTTSDINSALGSNSGNKVYGNQISNVNSGIVFIGSGVAAAMDTGNDVGGSSVLTGNTITNWGGNVSGTPSSFRSIVVDNYCIVLNHQINDNISFNTITSASNITTLETTGFGGILKNYLMASPASGTANTTSINNNTVTLRNTPTSGRMVGILARATSNPSAILNMNNNNILNCVITGGTFASFVGLLNAFSCGTSNVTGNTIRGITSANTDLGGVTGIIQETNAVINSLNISNNNLGDSIAEFVNFTGTENASTVTGISVTSSGAASTCAITITNNDFRGIIHTNTGSGSHNYIINAAASLSQNISLNTFTNLNVNTTGNITFISNNVSVPVTGFKTVNNNSIVTAFNRTGLSGTVTLYYDNASSTSTIEHQNNNNNFSNITLVGSTSMLGWANNDGTGSTPTKNITGNTFINWTCGASNVTVLHSNGGNLSNMSNNTISNITGQANITGLSVGSAGTTTALSIASNSIIGLSSTFIGGSVTGITNARSSNTITRINGNIISSLSSTSATATVVGISNSASANIYSNAINGLSCVGSTSGVTNGIMVTAGATVNVFKNKVYNLTTIGAFTTIPGVNGIVLSGTTPSVTRNIYNNLIGDLKASDANSTDAIRGISLTATGTSSTYNVFYNTVCLNASSSGANFGTSGIFHNASAIATTAVIKLKNNIIVNNSIAKGTGLAVAFRRSSNFMDNYDSTSNNNCFFGSSIFTDGTNTDVKFSSFKTRVSTRETASIFENPTFLSTSGASSDFLKFDTSIPTQIESGAVNISTFTDDYIGSIRFGNVGSSSTGTATDMGAWELNGLPPVVMSYVSSNTEQIIGNAYRGLSNQTIIRINVVTYGSVNPLLLSKLTLNANGTSDTLDINKTPAKIYYTGNSNIFSTFSLFGSAVPGMANYTISGKQELLQGNNYFWLSYDVANDASANNLLDGECVNVTVDSTIYVPSVTAPIGNKTILGPLNGNYNIGLSQTYPTLTAATADLSLRGVNGAVSFTLKSDYLSASETFPININNYIGANAVNTLTVKPDVGLNAIIIGSSLTSIIRLNGADYVTIDGSNNGGNSRNLTIVNTNTSNLSAVIYGNNAGTTDGATNNTIKNCIIVGNANTTTFVGVGFGGSSTITLTNFPTTSNNNNAIQNNEIRRCRYGIISLGVSIANKNSGTLITHNLINDSGANAIGIGGIYVTNESKITISSNSIANISGTFTRFGISLGTPLNTVYPIFNSNTVTGATISKNNVTSIESNSGFSAFGIVTCPALSDTITFSNNVIAGINSIAGGSNFIAGLYVGGGVGSNTFIYHNSILMSGNVTSRTQHSFALFVGGKNPMVTVKNNVLVNIAISTGTGKSYAFGIEDSVYSNLVFDYNNLFVSGTSGIVAGVGGIVTPRTQASLSELNTTISGGANSLSQDPLYIGSTLLKPAFGSPVLAAGILLGDITDDFDGITRNNPPSMGAYENATDIIKPTISHFSIPNSSSTASGTIGAFANISDGSGINTNSGNKPRLYYKKSIDSNIYAGNTSNDNGWKWVESISVASPFYFFIDYTILDGGGAAAGNTIQYFFVAQDLVSTPNVGISDNLGFTSTPSSVNLTNGAFPIIGTPSSYKILPRYSGTYSIGLGGTYSNLESFFDSINSGVVVGNINATIVGNCFETNTASLNQWIEEGTGNYKMSIYPLGAARTIYGSASGKAIVLLNGTDRVIIDGSINGTGNDRSLNIFDTIGNSNAIVFIQSANNSNGAINNTIKNCVITGKNKMTTFVGIGVGGNSSIRLDNFANSENNYNTIKNNEIKSCRYGIISIGVSPEISNFGTIISENKINGSGTNAVGAGGIFVANESGIDISQNSIANIDGNYIDVFGISLGVSSFDTYSPGTLNAATGATISKNKITSITSSGSSSAFGIVICPTAYGTNTITNNVISSINSDATLNNFIAGLYVGGGIASNTLIYNNSIYITGTSASRTGHSYALALGGVNKSVQVMNNILVNTSLSTQAGLSFALGLGFDEYTSLKFDYNNLVASGTSALIAGVESLMYPRYVRNLSELIGTIGGNSNLLSINPLFTNISNLEPSPAGYFAGIKVADLLEDINGTIRSPTRPHIGAYESRAKHWLGTSNDWTATSNWRDNNPPLLGDDVIIGYKTTFPILKNNLSISNLVLQVGTILGIGANTLTITGSINGTGRLSGSTTSNLSVGGNIDTFSIDQTAPGTTNVLQNLVIGTGSNASLTLGDALNIAPTGSITFNAAGTKSLTTTGQTLTLKSTAAGTASIGNLNGATITGNVTVERYVAGTAARGRWRFLSSPVQTRTIANWMTQFYITGPGDGTALGAPNTNGWHTEQANIDFPSSGTDSNRVQTTSIRTYDESTAGDLNLGWTNLSGTTQALSVGQGFRTFIRGPISGGTSQIGPNANSNVQGEATLSLTGAINSGNVTLPVSSTATGAGATFDSPNDGWNLLGNPYPSAYDWNAFWASNSNRTNIEPSVHVFDATANSYKAYNASSSSGTLTDGLIPSGAGFFIQTNATGAALTFTEAFKSTANPIAVHKTSKTDEFTIKYYKDGNENDEFMLKLMDGATLNNDVYDIKKLRNENLNLSSYGTDSLQLMLSSISKVKTETIIKLNVEATQVGTYHFEFKNMDNFDAASSVHLYDRFTNTTTAVKAGTKYTFEMGAGTNQWGNNRFELILNKGVTTGLEDMANNSSAVRLHIYPNPATSVLNVKISDKAFKNATIMISNAAGKEVFKGSMDSNQTQINIEDLSAGVYIIKVSNENGFSSTEKFVK